MTNKELVHFFYQITAPNGFNVSKRHNESFWRKNNFGHIYDEIIEKTNFISHEAETKLKDRIWCLENDIKEHPACVTCSSPVMFVDNHFSKYCCKKCSFSDPNISEIRKNSCKKVDVESANKKRSNTMKELYGVEYNSQRTKVKEILSASKLKNVNDVALKHLEDYDWMINEYIDNQRTLVDIAEELNVFYGTVRDYCIKHGFEIRQRTNYSLQEKELGQFLNSLNIEYISDRTVLNGKEIDLLVKDKNLGIELNGVYWHSYNRFESMQEKNNHLQKTLDCISSGITLMHIWDIEWIDKKEIVKSMISSRLGFSRRIYARNCIIKIVDTNQTKLFLNQNHIQGFTGSTVNLGLYHDEELVMLITFGKPRFNKEYDWELIRMATKNGINVVGGASKLLTNFRNNYTGSIICYADRRFGEGGVYSKIGFKYERSTSPGYYWTDGNFVWNRTKFQKSKLKNLLNTYDESKSEAENMFDNKYRRLWDCGVNVYVIDV